MTSTAAAPPPIRSGQFAALSTGVRLHYASCGDPANPLLLLLHGFPEFWAAWAGLMPALARRWYVVAPDLRGYNRSDKPLKVSDYAIAPLTADVLALADHFNAPRFALAAHDWRVAGPGR
jgi:epoxide hydrolase 4